MASTTVFQSGNRQAVRLPKEFRFKTKTVEIFRRADEVVLREKKRTLGEVLAELPPLTEVEVEELGRALADAPERRPLHERDGSLLFGPEPAPRPPRRRAR